MSALSDLELQELIRWINYPNIWGAKAWKTDVPPITMFNQRCLNNLHEITVVLVLLSQAHTLGTLSLQWKTISIVLP